LKIRAAIGGIGVDGLAAAAGVTSGAPYSNFPSKEAELQRSGDKAYSYRLEGLDAVKT
jgi:AcrR family transcriptional regulator